MNIQKVKKNKFPLIIYSNIFKFISLNNSLKEIGGNLNILINEKESILSTKLSVVDLEFKIGEIRKIKRSIKINEICNEELSCFTILGCCTGPDNFFYLLMDKYRSKSKFINFFF